MQSKKTAFDSKQNRKVKMPFDSKPKKTLRPNMRYYGTGLLKGTKNTLRTRLNQGFHEIE